MHDVLRSPGQPLDSELRAFMEPRFGHDFGRVRVHAGTEAARSAEAVNALAYTVGQHVVFGAGHYAPGTGAGRSLLAHELAHVVQQSDGDARPGRELHAGSAKGPEEHEAERLAGAAARGHALRPSAKVSNRLMRATRTYALTFDDGPHAGELGKGTNRTEKVLDTLKAKGIKAGFFVQTGVSYRGASAVGKKLIARMQAEGHKIGIHTGGTLDHELHTATEAAGRLESELEAAKKHIKTETGEIPALVRPPTGKSNKAVLATYAKVNLTNLLWDIDGDEGKELALKVLKDRIRTGIQSVQARSWKPTTASPSIVVLYHDIKKATADNLGQLIDHIKGTTEDLSGKKDTAAFATP